MIKFLFVYCAVLIVLDSDVIATTIVKISEDVHKNIITAAKQCLTNKLIISDLFTLVKDGKYKEEDEFKTFLYCTFKISGFANEDGNFKIERASALYPDADVAYKIMVECAKMRGSTPAETTFNFIKCFDQNSQYHIDLSS